MDLTVLLIMLLCSSCLSEQKAMDPDVKEEEKAGFGSSFSSAHTAVPLPHEHLSRTEQPVTQQATTPSPLPFLTESSPQPALRGNWCAFVRERLVSVAELSGDIVKSVNPCTNDDPDCQIFGYRRSSRPIHRQKQNTITALHWKCCPGYGGHDCKEKVSLTGESQSSKEHPEMAPTDVSQADDSDSGSGEAIPSSSPPPPSFSMPFMDSSNLLVFHQIFAAVITQLQPVLDGFNHTLENLSREVKGLSVDLKNLRHEQEHMSKTRHAQEKYEEDLGDSIKQMQQIWRDLDSQQKEIKHRVHLQEEHLLHNMTSLKDEIDHYINVSVQSLNKSMEEIRLTHERLHETTQVEPTPSGNASWSQASLETSVWDAISSLDMKVLNNTMELSPLIENSKHLINIAQKLDHGLRNLSERLEDVSHSTEVNLAQIGLEVEAARVATLKIVDELDSNLGTQERDLRETQLDVDNIYQHLQNNELATAGEICSCKEISDSLVRLESQVANVTNVAKENRYALEDAEAKTGTSQWAPELEDLHQGLWNVRESLAFEQVKRKANNDNLAQLKTSLLDSQKEINGLKEQFVAKEAEIGHLSASFNSLLEDAIRHSNVLEVLVGDEVIEFSSWSNSQQKELAIPVLLQNMRMMQEKIDSHETRLSSLRKISKDKAQMANDDPMAFTEWIRTKDQGNHTEEHQDSFPDTFKKEDDEDYSVSDFWSLGKEVEQLAHRLSVLEQHAWNCTAAPSGIVMELQKDVVALQQTLADHLRTFQNLFRYTEQLASSDGVNLDQLQTMMRTRERKKKKGQNMRKKGETGSMHRHTENKQDHSPGD